MLNLDAVSGNADWLRLAGRARKAGFFTRGTLVKEWNEELHERDENGRFTSGGGEALQVPDWVSPNNLVSAIAPHVGLSEVARETASRISDIKRLKVEKDAQGQKVTTYTATYTSKSGKEFNLVAAEKISPNYVTGRVVAQAEDSEYELRQDLYAPASYSMDAPFDLFAGDMEYGKTYKQIDESNVLYSQILAVNAWDKREGIGTAMLEFARATSTTAIMHSTSLTTEGEAFSEVVKEWNESSHPRDEHGRFGSGGGSSILDTPPVTMNQPGVWKSKYAPPGVVESVVKGKENYIRDHGFPVRDIDYMQIVADPEKGTAVAEAYDALPSYSDDPHTVEAYTALRDEIKEQYDYMTNEMGITVDVLKTDPYKSAYELQQDLADNNHIAVLATSETGGHPFFTNEENDMFRAVHDTFGHMGAGTGFDRNGEEAAFVSHYQMFSPLASEALATETRGQNSWLTFLGNGNFAEQKFAVLPREFSQPYLNEGMQVVKSIIEDKFLHDDEARNLALFGTVNTSLGRRLPVAEPNGVTFDNVEPHEVVKEWDEDKYVRDERGRFSSNGVGGVSTSGGGVNVVGSENMREKVWSPMLAKVDTMMSDRYGFSKNFEQKGNLREIVVNQYMKEVTAESLADKLSDIDVTELADSAHLLISANVRDALTFAEDRVVDGITDDYRFISLDDDGRIVSTEAHEFGNLESQRSYDKQDVLEVLSQEPLFALQGTPEAEEMVRQAACGNLISLWASSSNNASPDALAMQEIASKEFGVANHASWQMAPFVEDKVESNIQEHGDIYALFLRAQYDGTQEFLKANGVDSVTVYRGMKELPENVVSQVALDSTQNIQMRPLSSWSGDEEVARNFAYSPDGRNNVSVIMQATIPAEQILSMPGTGFGCLHEQEFVVLGGEKTVTAYTVEDYIEASKAGKDVWGK